MLRKTPAERFWLKVQQASDDACWIWIGAIGSSGYGNFGVNGKYVNAHRFAYILEHGEIPDGALVLHDCDNKLCVNYRHLFIGSYQDNADDCKTKGRTAGPHFIGEDHGMAKTNELQVRQIRAAWKSGAQIKQLAEQYGLGRTTVSHIVHRRTWIFVEDTSETT